MARTVSSFNLLFPIILLAACARVGAPTGGEKDVTPPRIDTLVSTRNYQTGFTGRRIELTFDEYVTLQDVGTQVIVSPPLAKRPEVTLRGKTVRFQFDESEVLRPNTTYTINFGTAVKDFHEGNVAKDLRFVFSTGTQIDSLRLSGSVVDAQTGDPVPEMAVLLYENLADSAVVQERPFYYARTNELGLFSLQNLRADTFRLLAVEDVSTANLRWNPATERVAFLDSLLVLRAGPEPKVFLRLYNEPGASRLAERTVNQFGTVRLVYSGTPDTGGIRALAPEVRLLSERTGDTVYVYYDRAAAGTWSLLVGADTVAVRGAPSRAEFLQTHRVVFADDIPGGGNNRGRASVRTAPIRPGPPRTVAQNPNRSATLLFPAPIDVIDTARWLLVADSQRVRAFTARRDSVRLRTVRLSVDWRPGKQYRLTLLPGAVTDIFGVANLDTLQRTFSVAAEKQLGGLNLVLTDLTPGMHYVLQLLNGNALEEERAFRAAGAEVRQEFRRLSTATYTARLVEDRNANGRWDPGQFFAGRQPEPVFTRKLEALRPNWEVETTFSPKEVGAGARGKRQ